MFPVSLVASLGGIEAVYRRCPDGIKAVFGRRSGSIRTTPKPALTEPSNIQNSLFLCRFYNHFQADIYGVQTASRGAITRSQGGVWAASKQRLSGVLVASGRRFGASQTPLGCPSGHHLAAVIVGCKMLKNLLKNQTFGYVSGIAWRWMGRRPATTRMPPGHRADVARTSAERRPDAARTLPGDRLDAPQGAAWTPSVSGAKCL